MPKVGGKHFAYTPAGEKAASAYAKKTGMPLMKNYKDGGPVKNYKKAVIELGTMQNTAESSQQISNMI